ncbi:MAG: pilin, partial [Rhodoferax sp.]|nr:pilin [Rhodoferax sp.]
MPQSRDTKALQRGFTLIEILLVIGVLGVLAAIAIPAYQGYVARSHASELALKFDAIRTKMQVVAKSGDVQPACATLAEAVQPGNLRSDYTHMSVDFEPVSGGFTPVLTLCASAASQGAQGVEVTRQAHQLLGRDSVISPGAVIGDAAVSFSVRLAGGAALCKTQPPAAAARADCATGPAPSNTASANSVATTPAVAASQPGTQAVVQPATQPIVQSGTQPVAVVSQPVASAAVAASSTPLAQPTASGPKACPAVAPRPVNRQVMHF